MFFADLEWLGIVGGVCGTGICVDWDGSRACVWNGYTREDTAILLLFVEDMLYTCMCVCISV